MYWLGMFVTTFAVLLSSIEATSTQTGSGAALNGEEVRTLLAGRTTLIERDHWIDSTKSPPRKVYERIRYVMEFRADGSYALQCFVLSRNGPAPCYPTPRILGVWEIRGNELCSAPAGFRKSQYACYVVARESATRIFVRQTNAAEVLSNGTGPVELQ